MRGLVLVGLVALAGCEADGRPSPLIGSALSGFAKGYGATSDATERDKVQREAQKAARPAAKAPVMVPPPPSAPAGMQAFFTGRSEQVQTVTGLMAWQCEYHYAGRDFVLLFENYCPPSASIR